MMADVSLDLLESVRFRKLRVDGNVTLTVQGNVLVVGSSPRITVAPLAPDAPAVGDLWIDTSADP